MILSNVYLFPYQRGEIIGRVALSSWLVGFIRKGLDGVTTSDDHHKLRSKQLRPAAPIFRNSLLHRGSTRVSHLSYHLSVRQYLTFRGNGKRLKTKKKQPRVTNSDIQVVSYARNRSIPESCTTPNFVPGLQELALNASSTILLPMIRLSTFSSARQHIPGNGHHGRQGT